MSTTSAAATVSVEYAKSGRSTCKGCGAAIASGALRLGTSTRDPRGFDSTKWYHASCFPVASHSLGPVESIHGFDAIKDDDREELRQMEKNPKTSQTDVTPLDEPSPKKVKTQVSSPGPGEAVSDNASVYVEYAKSGRSTCKGCNENIAKGALRVGASFHDPRGFENMKWYHATCFPTSTYPISPVEHLKGFNSIEHTDREKLRKLEKNHKLDGDSADQLTEPNLETERAQSMRDSKESIVEEVKNHKTSKSDVAPSDKPSPKKVKTQVSSPGEGLSDNASVSVEYAKSGRSTCKQCNENIAKGALRIGASFHDPRGFENTKWYHAACFPTSTYPISPVEQLKGFDSIEDTDREKLQKLEKNHKIDGDAADPLTEPNLKNETAQSMGDSKDGAEKTLKEVKRGEASVGPLDKPSPKKVKGASGEASVSVEYAKSGRSTCKGCSENIAKGALRLGVSAHDPRGFDSTKWYHVECFPTSSYPIFPVENLKGFDSIENQDREKLQELESQERATLMSRSS